MPLRSCDIRNLLLIFALVVLVGMSPRGAATASVLQVGAGGSGCSDSIKNCKKPVKFISRDDSCYTFACEYGTAAQHNIHVSNPEDVKTLLQLGR